MSVNELRDWLERLLEADCITASTSTFEPSPVVTIRKKDGTVKFAIDFRNANARLIPFAYPIPDLERTLDLITSKQSLVPVKICRDHRNAELDRD